MQKWLAQSTDINNGFNPEIVIIETGKILSVKGLSRVFFQGGTENVGKLICDRSWLEVFSVAEPVAALE